MTVQNFKKDKSKETEPEAALAIDFDVNEFMHFLDGTGWSDAQKSEYLELVWDIVCQFVAMGFDVHPLQQAQMTCGEPSDIDAESTRLDSAMVNSSHGRLIEKFVHQSRLETVLDEEGVIDG